MHYFLTEKTLENCILKTWKKQINIWIPPIIFIGKFTGKSKIISQQICLKIIWTRTIIFIGNISIKSKFLSEELWLSHQLAPITCCGQIWLNCRWCNSLQRNQFDSSQDLHIPTRTLQTLLAMNEQLPLRQALKHPQEKFTWSYNCFTSLALLPTYQLHLHLLGSRASRASWRHTYLSMSLCKLAHSVIEYVWPQDYSA